jgi:Septum formation initiator
MIGIVGVAVYLYYRPIASYVETRNDLSSQRAEVESLRLVRGELQLRLVNSTSVDLLEREARRIGYVKPGERLFVVKGIPAWRRARTADRP